MAQAAHEVVSFGQAGVITWAEDGFELLPLMQPPLTADGKNIEPPLHVLPRGDTDPDRIAFETAVAETSAAGASSSSRGGPSKTKWIASTHLFPSAYPRSHYVSVRPPGSAPPQPERSRADVKSREEEKKLRDVDLEKYEELVTLTSVESLYPPADPHEAQRMAQSLANAGQPQLWSCVERIVPQRPEGRSIASASKAATLFLSHANGFHKEIWEPFLETLLASLEEKQGVHIEEIWSLDAFQSGTSGTLNRQALGTSMSWFDHVRDMWQFLDYYLPTQAPPEDMARFGPRWPPKILPVTTRGRGRKGRSIIGIGHSFGGATMSILNLSIGDIMAGQIAIDPIILDHEQLHKMPIPRDVPLARGAISRKDVFTSRAAAKDYMRAKPYFQAWDPRVLDLHVRFGLAPLPGHEGETNPPVTLCMSKWSEAFSFSSSFMGSFASRLLSRDRVQYKGWSHLLTSPYLDSGLGFVRQGKRRCYLHDVYAKHGPRFTSESTAFNHLMVQENPVDMGRKIADVIHTRLCAKPGLDSLPKGKL